MTEKSQGGKALVRPTTLAGRMRRRLTTAPRPSSPTRLQLFLPRSIPRTAICIWFLPSFKSPATITRLAEGAGHPINFLALVEETAAKEASGKPIEIWFQDEARIGQKNKVTHRWAKRGTRPSVPHDQRTRSAYIFGAICPAEGKGAGLVLPSCNSEAMALHLEEISLAVAPGAHAIVLLDQAGWHVSKSLSIPDNITLLPLRRNRPSSIRSRTSGNSCATIGSRTASSNPTTTSSIIAASPGISSSTCPAKSSPSGPETGSTGHDHQDLVLESNRNKFGVDAV